MTLKEMMWKHSTEKPPGYTNKGADCPDAMVVPADTITRWTAAIRSDDVITVEAILNEITIDQQEALLDANLIHLEADYDNKGPLVVSSSWCLAGVCGAREVMKLLLKYNVNVLQMSKSRENILHCLVRGAKLGGEQAEQGSILVYEWLLEQLPNEVIEQLLIAEDKEQLRPLELAVYLCTFHLANSMLNTEGVYKTIISRGLYEEDLFNVTDYEAKVTANRRDRSPLFLLIASPYLGHTSNRELCFLKSELVKAWISVKVNSNILFVIFWFLSRLLYISLFVLLDLAQQGGLNPSFAIGNLTIPVGSEVCRRSVIPISDTVKVTIATFLTLFSLSILLHALYNLVKDCVILITRKCSKGPTQNWVPPLRLDIFDFFQICSAMTTGAYSFLIIVYHSKGSMDDVVQQVFVLINMPLFFLELLQFTIFLPKVGHYALVIKEMIRDLGVFLAIFCGFILSQAYVLQRVVSICPSGITNFLFYFYQCVLVLLTNQDIGHFISGSTLKEVWHLTYMLFGSLMLFNFLIALFTQTFSEIAAARPTMLAAARIRVIYKIESVIRCILPCWYRFVHHRFFTNYNGRTSLKVTRYSPHTLPQLYDKDDQRY